MSLGFEIIGLVEELHLDTLIQFVTLYYMFKVCNMAVITGGNMSETLVKIFKAWRDEE